MKHRGLVWIWLASMSIASVLAAACESQPDLPEMQSSGGAGGDGGQVAEVHTPSGGDDNGSSGAATGGAATSATGGEGGAPNLGGAHSLGGDAGSVGGDAGSGGAQGEGGAYPEARGSIEFDDELNSLGDWTLTSDPDGETATAKIADGSLYLEAEQTHACPKAQAQLLLPQLDPLASNASTIWTLDLFDLDLGGGGGQASLKLNRAPREITLDIFDLQAKSRQQLVVEVSANGVQLSLDGEPFSDAVYSTRPVTDETPSVTISVSACAADFYASAVVGLERLVVSRSP